MTPPKDALLLGHPAIVTPVILGLIGVFWAGCYDHGWWVLGFVLLWPVGAVARASSARTDYFQWKKAWDGMAEQPARPQRPRSATPARWRPWVGGLMLAGIALYCFAQAGSDPFYAVAAVWLVLAMPVAGALAWLVRRAKGGVATATANAAPVTVCIARPLLSVPSLKHAYQALPPHCLMVLGIGRR